MKILAILFGVFLLCFSSVIYQDVYAIDRKCSNDCEPPTLGLDQSGKRMVNDGIIYNKQVIDVTDYSATYQKITDGVGKENTAKFRIYDNWGPDNIEHFELAFGLSSGQTLQDSKVRIIWDRSLLNEEKTTIVDPDNVLEKVTVNSGTEKCDVGKNQCLTLIIHHTFRAPLEGDIVATNIWDHYKNAWQNYYTQGIHITGKSLNPVKSITAINSGKIYHLIKTGKDTAADEFGDGWTLDVEWSKNLKKTIKLPAVVDPNKLWALEHLGRSDDVWVFGYKRDQVEFKEYKNKDMLQKDIFTKILYPGLKAPHFLGIDNIKSIAPKERSDKLADFKVIYEMKKEAERAELLVKTKQ